MVFQRALFLGAVTTSAAFCLLGSGCELSPADREEEIPAPLCDVERQLRPGLSPEAVQQLLGAPEQDFLDTNEDPPVLRTLDYNDLGLHLQFHATRGLASVAIGRRWNKAVQGLRYGDRLDPEGFQGKSGIKAFRSCSWPYAFFFFDTDGEHVKVRTIVLQDRSSHGRWSPAIPFGGTPGTGP
jgi:hypothetical protein